MYNAAQTPQRRSPKKTLSTKSWNQQQLYTWMEVDMVRSMRRMASCASSSFMPSAAPSCSARATSSPRPCRYPKPMYCAPA